MNQNPPFDLILSGGHVLDGSPEPPRRADLGIAGDRIAAIGDLSQAATLRRLDVAGRFVTPGFVDIHTHTDETVFLNPRMESKIHQGVTTEVTGNCGESAAPLLGEAYAHMARDVARYPGLTLTWRTLGEYLDRVQALGLSTNYVTLVGQGTLRASVMGYEMRAATGTERAEMQRLLASSLEAGAWGMSTGLIYPPSSYADLDELVALAGVAAEHGGIYTSHLRNEGDRLIEAVAEGLAIGERAGIPVQLSHHKAAGKRNWGKVRESLALIERARANGIAACADQYPYVASSTGLDTVLPPWAHAGGRDKMVARLQDGASRSRIAAEVNQPGAWGNPAVDSGWDRIVIAGCKSDRTLQGKTVQEIAVLRGCAPFEAAADLLVANEGSVQIVIFSMDEKDVRTVMRLPWVFVGSDSTARAPAGPLSEVQCHPRTYGTFPRLLGHYVRDLGILSWELAIRKMTSGPAEMLGLDRRGRLGEGYYADIVVFDPATVADTATFAAPHRFPAGIDYVLVNGVITIDNGAHTGALAGKVLRK